MLGKLNTVLFLSFVVIIVLSYAMKSENKAPVAKHDLQVHKDLQKTDSLNQKIAIKEEDVHIHE